MRDSNSFRRFLRNLTQHPSRKWFTPTGKSRILTWIMVVIVAVGGLTHVAVDRILALPEDAVVRVGDTTVNKADFAQRVQLMAALYGVQPPPPGPAHDRFQRDAARAVAVSIVLQHAATNRHIGISDAQAQDVVQKMIQSQFPNGHAGFEQALQQKGITERNVLDEIKRQLATSQLYQNVTRGTAAVTEPDIERAYQKRRSQLVTPEHRHIKNIVVDSPEKAQQVLAQLRGGADFATVAAQNSLDKSTAGNGGDLGSVTADQLERPVADAAFAAPNGGFYSSNRGRFGWNVGQVIEVQPAQPLSLDQARDQLRAQLDEERHLDRWRPWLTQQVAGAGVKYAGAYRPANPNQLPPEILK